jgi:Uma2 family endonuclease
MKQDFAAALSSHLDRLAGPFHDPRVSPPNQRRATYDDLAAVPDHLVAELIDGQLHTFPRPAAPHTRAASRMGALLDGPFDRGVGGPGGWVILDEPELHLHGDVLVPDLAGWRRERMPKMPQTAAFELAPDWTCEVLSPSTAAIDRADKMPVYARERVGHVWLVDPLARTLEVFWLDGATYRLMSTHRDETIVTVPPFEALGLELAALWAT